MDLSEGTVGSATGAESGAAAWAEGSDLISATTIGRVSSATGGTTTTGVTTEGFGTSGAGDSCAFEGTTTTGSTISGARVRTGVIGAGGVSGRTALNDSAGFLATGTRANIGS